MAENLLTSSNPLLSAVKLPGRVLPLPSRGVFYKPEDKVLAPDVVNGEIEVKPMSALAEMKLKTADLLFSGKIIKELCLECIPGILNPDLLVNRDVDALFAFLRLVTYGSKQSVSSMHPGCKKEAKVNNYEIELEPLLSNPRNKILDHVDTLYHVKLSNGQAVRLRPPTYMSSMKIVHLKQELDRLQTDINARTDEGLIEKIMIEDMLAVIDYVETEVDGKIVSVNNRDYITAWIRKLSKPLMQEIITGAKRADEWGFEFKADFKCKECGEVYKHDLDLDPINFFYG